MTMKRFTYFILAAAVLFFCACESPELTQDPVEVIPQDQPTLTTIVAGFEAPDTKTILSIDGSVGKVLWKSGDKFRLYSLPSSGDFYYYDDYTTTDDGVTSANFTADGSGVTVQKYNFAISPSTAADNAGTLTINDDSKIACFAKIPNTQTATAGTFDPKACLAVAFSEDNYDHLLFQNMVSLLRVKVKGSAAKLNKLKSIRVQAHNQGVSGKIAVYYDESQLKFAFPSSGPVYNYAEISDTNENPFAAGTDYYIAVAPGNYQGISVTLFFDDDTYLSKTLLGNKTLNLAHSSIQYLGEFDVDGTPEASITQYPTYSVNPTGTKPVVICVIPDGFTSDQKATFTNRAKEGMDFFFSVEPYKTYKNYFKVYFIWTPSLEAGASITNGSGAITTQKNTAFGSRWGETLYGDMTADDGKVYSFVSANCPEIVNGTLSIDDVAILMLINDTRYGGIAHNTASGRTYCQTPFANNGGTLYWNFPSKVANTNEPMNPLVKRDANAEESALTTTGDWRNILLHEFGGHSFGRLSDEYWDVNQTTFYGQRPIDEHSWSPLPYGKNISGYYDTYPWAELLSSDGQTAMNNKDARYTTRIGRYQGAGTEMFNRWRSEIISCMIDNRPYFSTWQRKLIVDRILKLANGTDDVSFTDFLASDVITNPVAPPTKAAEGTITFMPPLPPPILIDNSTPSSPILVGEPVK